MGVQRWVPLSFPIPSSVNIVWVSSFSIFLAHLTNLTNAHSMCYNDVLGGVNTSPPPLAAEPSCLALQPFLFVMFPVRMFSFASL